MPSTTPVRVSARSCAPDKPPRPDFPLPCGHASEYPDGEPAQHVDILQDTPVFTELFIVELSAGCDF